MVIMLSAGRCQFCHSMADDVRQVVAGDSGFICEECVRACADLLTPKAAKSETVEYPERHTFQRLIRHFAPWKPNEMLVTSREFPTRQQADLQKALDAVVGKPRVPENFVGIHPEYRHHSYRIFQATGAKPRRNQNCAAAVWRNSGYRAKRGGPVPEERTLAPQ